MQPSGVSVPSALPAPEQKSRTVQRMFDRIAPRYDLLNRLMTLGTDQRWRRRVVERVQVGADDVVLDLASGTGDFAGLARRCGATVVALDFSREMLRMQRERGFTRGDAIQ